MARVDLRSGLVGRITPRVPLRRARRAALSGGVGRLVLVASVVACSSGSDGSPTAPAGAAEVEGGAGGDRPEVSDTDPSVPGAESAPGGEATGGEARDPSQIGNVTPRPVTPDPGSPGDAPAADGAPGAGAAPEPSGGCGALALVSSGEQSIEVAGVTRTFMLDVPSGYDGTLALPLVFAFHGATTSGAFFRSAFYGNLLSTLQDVALVVHADALGDPSAWDDQADLPFFDAMLASLEASACVDRARVFATGHSSGGFFTNTLGCQRGDVLRAIAPVSAGGPFVFGANACTGEVAVWLAHAQNDEVVSFDLGVASRDRWLEANGCSDTSAAAEPAPCVEYSGCSSGLPVRWCVYDDGHDWPEFGPEGIWGFFGGL